MKSKSQPILGNYILVKVIEIVFRKRDTHQLCDSIGRIRRNESHCKWWHRIWCHRDRMLLRHRLELGSWPHLNGTSAWQSDMACGCCTSAPCDALQLNDRMDWTQGLCCTVYRLPSQRSLHQRCKCCIASPSQRERARSRYLRWFQLLRWMPSLILHNRNRNPLAMRSLAVWIQRRFLLPHPSNGSTSRCDLISLEVESMRLEVL